MKYRYREPHEMKDSKVEWLGMIPKEWDTSLLKYITSTIKGYAFKSDIFKEKGRLIVKASDIKNNTILKGDNFIEESLNGEFEKVKLKYKDIVMSTVGSSPDVINSAVGQLGRVPKEVEGSLLNQNTVILRFNKKTVYNDFMFYLLSGNKFRKFLDLYAHGTANQASLTLKEILQFPFIYTSLEKQIIITNFLDKKTAEFDLVIEKKEKLIKKLEEAKKSLISEVVTGKKEVISNKSYKIGNNGQEQEVFEYSLRNREPHEMKDTGVEWLGMIPEEWEPIKVKHTFKFFRGLPITKADLKDEGVQCLNYGEIHSKYPCFIDTKNNNLKNVSEEYLKTNSNSLLKNGDLVFADTSEDLKGSGNFTYIGGNENIFAGYHTVTIRSNENKPNKYLAYLFDSMDIRKQIQFKVKGVKVYSITQSILKDIFILKSKEEEKIADFLDQKTTKFDSIIQKNKDQIKKIKEAKQSLISEAVTGKIEVID